MTKPPVKMKKPPVNTEAMSAKKPWYKNECLMWMLAMSVGMFLAMLGDLMWTGLELFVALISSVVTICVLKKMRSKEEVPKLLWYAFLVVIYFSFSFFYF